MDLGEPQTNTATKIKQIYIQNRNRDSEGLKRMNFLFKASRMFSQLNESYSRYLLYEFLQVGQKKVIRINRKVKRLYCKRCITFLSKRLVKSIRQSTQSIKASEGPFDSVTIARSANPQIDVCINRYEYDEYSNQLPEEQRTLPVLRYTSINQAIERLCEDISRTLLLGDYTKIQEEKQEVLGLMVKGNQLRGYKLSQFYSMLSVLMFNLSLSLEKTKTVFQNSLIESTGIQEFDQNKVIRKFEEINEQVGLFMRRILLSKELETLLLSMRETKTSKSLELSALMQTIEFLTTKYQIDSPLTTVTKPKVMHLLLESAFSSAQVSRVNNTLFSEGSKGAITIIRAHHQSFHVIMSLCVILHANDSKRSFFAKTPPSRQILTDILEYVVRSSKPFLTFSQQHFAAQPFCSFLTAYMLFEFGECHAQFTKIINKFVVVEDQHKYYKRHVDLFSKINELLESFIPSRFGNFLSLVFKTLCNKHTKDESIEIMKLLVFNRFLLDPQIKCNLDSLSQDFSLHSNRVRNIFFPTKLRHIQSILPTSMQCFNTFSTLCQANDKNKDAKTLFVTDKTLQIFYKDIQQAIQKEQQSQILLALRTPISSKTQTRPPMNNTSITKNLLQDLSKSSLNQDQLQLSSTEIMDYLSQYRLQSNHQLNQRQTYWESNRNMDGEFSQRFFAVSNKFNDKKQEVLAARRLHRMNSLLPL